MKISVAYIQKPRGFNGELAAVPYKADTQSLRPGLEVTLQKGDGFFQSAIQSVTYLNGRLGLKLKGIDSEEMAKMWRGAEILVELDNLEKRESGEYFHFEIEGCEVFEESGEHVGKVISVDTTAANDLLNIQSEHGDILIPFLKVFVKSVDIENKKIIIKKIEGLY